jgi:hypothetical protein
VRDFLVHLAATVVGGLIILGLAFVLFHLEVEAAKTDFVKTVQDFKNTAVIEGDKLIESIKGFSLFKKKP